MSLRNLKTIKERKEFIENITKSHFGAINIYPKKIEEAQFKNCENMIGAISIPLGIAGPLRINGDNAKGDYYIPLATTEGALVASISRGCKAITVTGGARVYMENEGITRGLIFKTSGIAESVKLKKWLDDNFSLITQTAASTSSHLKLKKFFTKMVGVNVYVRFSFDTGDAMGMNMATFASKKIADLIYKKTGFSCISLAGNFDIDKKPAWLNFILGRGKQVWAEVTLDEQIVKEVLKTTVSKIHQVAKDKCLVGSILSGSVGFNAHFANCLAALFIACGQDTAHVVEGSLGITTTEIIDRSLYISVYIPDLALGTVGGGTALPSQKEALSILSSSKKGVSFSANAFAEIAGATVLAGEISLLASLAEGSLALAHQKLARGKTK